MVVIEKCLWDKIIFHNKSSLSKTNQYSGSGKVVKTQKVQSRILFVTLRRYFSAKS